MLFVDPFQAKSGVNMRLNKAGGYLMEHDVSSASVHIAEVKHGYLGGHVSG